MYNLRDFANVSLTSLEIRFGPRITFKQQADLSPLPTYRLGDEGCSTAAFLPFLL